ncbi:MAG: hypothetical protein ABI625_13615 [bacterium]
MLAQADVQAPTTPAPAQVVIKPGTSAPEAVYKAFNEQRRELANQLENLEEKRRELARQVSEPATEKSVKAGLEQRVAELDKRIADVDKQLAAADQSVAQAAAVPGAVVPPPREPRNGPPEEVFVLAGMFIVVVFFPLSIALARRIWKRGAAAVTAFPQELADRLNRLDQSMDSIAIEVERIGEGQRFVTRVMSESGRAVGGGAAQPIEVGVRGASVGQPPR